MSVDLERKLQNKVLHWLIDEEKDGGLGYIYLGNLEDQDNTPVKEDLLKKNLQKRGYTKDQISKAVNELVSKASNQAGSLYQINKEVYSLLRYGKQGVKDENRNRQTVHYIDWDNVDNNDFYVAETLRLSGVDGLRFLSSRSKSLALGPGEKKSVYFVFEVTNKLSDNFMYTFPLRLFVGNQFFSSEIKVFKGSSIVLEEDVLLFLDEEKELVLGLRCEATPIIRVGESLLVSCDYLNDEGLLCLGDFCEFVNEDFYLSLEMFEPGFFSRPVLFESSKSGSSRLSFVKFLVIDNSSLDLSKTYQSDVINPSDIGFLNISLKKNSSSVPLNVSLFIVHDYFVEEMFFDSVDNEVVFIFNFPARNLKKGINEFLVNVTFVDVLGNQFFEELYLEVSVEGLSLLDEVDFFFRKVYFWFKNLW